MAGRINIFLVEDDDLDFEILKRGMNKSDLKGRLVRARDGLDALELLTNDLVNRDLPHPFVILLDINMPRMNGHEFLGKLREIVDLRHMQVIVFTTSDNPKDIMRAYQHNVSGYITKPNTSAELRNILGKVEHFWNMCEPPVPFQQQRR